MSEGFNLGGETMEQAGVNAAASSEGMVFDLGGVEEASFEVIPRGTYNAIIEDLEFTESQSSGAPMLKAVFSITDGEYAERKVFDYYVLTGEGAKYSLPKLKQLVSRVCPEVDLASFNPAKFAEDGVAVNRACQIKLAVTTQKKGEYKGEKRNNVREILSAADVQNSFLG